MPSAEELVAVLDQACQALSGPQRQQAEDKIQELGQTPYPLILEVVQTAWTRCTNTYTLFHSGMLLKRAIVRDWNVFGSNQAQVYELIMSFFYANRHLTCEKAVVNQVIQCFCVFQKLCWASCVTSNNPDGIETIKNQFIMKLLQSLMGDDKVEPKQVAMNVASNLISEFSNTSTTTTDLGQAWETHERCRLSFQDHLLQHFFEQAAGLLDSVHQHKALQHAPTSTAHLIKSCMNVINGCLIWNFDPLTPDRVMSYTSREDVTILTPPAEWAGCLLNAKLVGVLVELHSAVASFDESASAVIRQACLFLSSLNGKMFTAQGHAHAAQAKSQHFDRMMGAIFHILKRAMDGDPGDPDVGACFVGGCQAMLRLVNSISAEVGWFVSQSFIEYCRNTLQLTLHIMGLLTKDPLNDFLIECFDTLLEVWVALITHDQCRIANQKFARATNSSLDEGKVKMLHETSAQLFQNFVEFHINHATKGDDDDDADHDKEYYKSQLYNVAQLARETPGPSLGLLTNKLNEVINTMTQSTPNDTAALEKAQDVCLFVVQLAGEVIADAGESETPQIPDQIILMSQQHERKPNAEQLNEVCVFMRSVLHFAHVEDSFLDKNVVYPYVSPLVCKNILAFLTRMVKSYLLPCMDLYIDFCVTLNTAFSEGRDLANACISKCRKYMRMLSAEAVVIDGCVKLLQAIVARKGVQKILMSSDEWRGLVEDEKNLNSLPGSQRRGLFQALCVGFPPECFQPLVQPLAQQFTAIIQQQGFTQMAQQESVLGPLNLCLEKLRGVSRSSLSGKAQQSQVFTFFVGVLPALVQLVDLYHTRNEVVIMILRLFDDLVVSQNMFMTADESLVLFERCLEAIQIYEKHNRGSKTSVLSSAEEDEQLEALETLLDLMLHITEWDMMDFNGEEIGNRKFDIGQTAFIGLRIILRLISEQTLQVPTVAQQFFRLLLTLIQVYPDQLVSLDDALLQMVLQAIIFAMDNPSIEVCRSGFKAIAAIAQYHHSTNCQSALSTKLQGNFPSQMFTKVLTCCVDASFDMSLLQAVSSATFTLMCILQENSQAVLMQAIAQHPHRERILAAFQKMTTANGIAFNTTQRNNKSIFANNFEEFVGCMRALRMR